MTARQQDSEIPEELEGLRLLTRQTTAKILDCHPTYIDKLCANGSLKAVLLGRRAKRVTLESVHKFLSNALIEITPKNNDN